MWISDIGWMMGPWQIIGAQQLGGTHVIFEGAINHPGPDRVWAMIEKFGITHLGSSATAYRMLKSLGDHWLEAHDLSSLRATGNTGEPIDPDTWSWVMEKVGGGRCPLINLSGGTEIFGCFLLPLPVMPLKPSTLGGPGLGMAIDVYNDEGEPVRGEIGYLVCKKPSPSMTRGSRPTGRGGLGSGTTGTGPPWTRTGTGTSTAELMMSSRWPGSGWGPRRWSR